MTRKLIKLEPSRKKDEKGQAHMVGGGVEQQLATLRAQMEQLMREFYGSQQTPGVIGQLLTMRKEITADQLALRRELMEQQNATRDEFFSKQEELRRELTERQERMQTELSKGQTEMREDFISAKAEMKGSVHAVLRTLGILGAIVLGIPAIGTFIFAVLDHLKH